MVSPIDRLARELVTLKSQVKGLSRTPQLAYSSIENGSVDEYNADGQLSSIIGKQYDGSHGAYPVSGPNPPRPTAPAVEAGTSATVSWDGLFVDDLGAVDVTITAPMDWARAELHISKTQGFQADTADTLFDTIETPRGGSRPVLPAPGVWYAVLVARSLAGKRSEQSAETAFEVVPGLTDEDVQALRDEFGELALDLNRALQENGAAQALLGQQMGTLQSVTLPALEGAVDEAQGRLDDADELLKVSFPQRIKAAEDAAAAAGTKAGAAETTAGSALSKADAALTMAGSGARVLYSTANPSGTAREGDTWRKTASALGDVVGEWRYTKNAAGTLVWTPQKVTSDMVSNLDVGKLTAGTGTFTQAVAEKMAAATAAFQTADIGNLTVTGDSALNTLTAQRIAAGVATFLSVTTDQLVAGSASLGTAVADKFFADIFATRKLSAQQVFIGAGGNLIPDPGFTDAALNGGRQTRSTGTWALVPGTATEPAAMRHVMTGTNDAFQYWPDTPTAARTGELIKVSPGQVFNLAVDITTTHSATTRWNAYLLKADGTVAYTGLTTWAAATGRRELKQEYTIPAGVVGIAFAVACLTNGGTFTVHGNATVTEKITPALIVEGFFQGLRVIGASIETNSLANRGLKLNDAGLKIYTADGLETLSASEAGVTAQGEFVAVAQQGTVKLTPDIPGESVASRTSAGLRLFGPNGDLRGTVYTGYAIPGVRMEGPSSAVRVALIPGRVEITAPEVTVNGQSLLPNAWTLIPLTAGRSALDGNKPAVRVDPSGEYYEFTGGVAMTAGTSTNPAVTFLTVPAGFRPPTFKNFVVATSAGPQGLTISSAGAMYLNPTGISGGGWVDFSQLRYAIAGPR